VDDAATDGSSAAGEIRVDLWATCWREFAEDPEDWEEVRCLFVVDTGVKLVEELIVDVVQEQAEAG